MPNGWTAERRARQAQLIRSWRPWERSTGPRTAAGRARVSRNAYKGATRATLKALRKALAEQDQARERMSVASSGLGNDWAGDTSARTEAPSVESAS